MTICIVDGRGGGLGRRIVEGLHDLIAEGHEVLSLGLNRSSAQAMARAGASRIEMDEQAINRQLGRAHMIVGSLSLLMPGAMSGEVTPGLVQAIVESPARKFLLPLNRKRIEVVGLEGRTLESLIEHAVQQIVRMTKSAA
jgi:NAD(P)-dependent dehydrogenase (short-subunit alcohol dehydrogenase family)